MAEDQIRRRPERVVIVDADDPMTEIEGSFVWQEEHERVLDEVCRQAFADGYAAGQRDALPLYGDTVRVDVPRRRSVATRLKLAVLLLGVLCLLLALPYLALDL